MRGSLVRRGKNSWRIKIELPADPATGKRRYHRATFRGLKKDAAAEAARLLAAYGDGAGVEPSKMTVAELISTWLSGEHGLAGKTHERYLQIFEQQIKPHLGDKLIQKLRPSDVAEWHQTLLKSGGKEGRPLGPRTVGSAHRILHRALARGVALELVTRNVASAVKAPKVEDIEIESLDGAQVADVLTKLAEHPLYPIIALALGTGARRGEILALRWQDIDLDGASIRIERALEQTKKLGLRFKVPKTRHSKRTVSLPSSAVDALREHRRKQLELRVAMGLGRLSNEALAFSTVEGGPMSPDSLSYAWRGLVKSRRLPQVSFHGLRHSHASALIAAGLDVLSISRRLGHASAAITLKVYGHMFQNKDDVAAHAIDAVMKTPK